MRDYLDAETGDIPESIPDPALQLALFFGSIVAWVTDHLPDGDPHTNVPCRRRGGGFRLRPEDRVHRSVSRFMTRARTSSQGSPADSPLMTRRARRSISLAHAVSTLAEQGEEHLARLIETNSGRNRPIVATPQNDPGARHEKSWASLGTEMTGI
jgi:hypothetical protein